jgi:hypothetical protein
MNPTDEDEIKLLLLSKDARIKYYENLLRENKISFLSETSSSSPPSLETIMEETCSLFNRYMKNKRMYCIENTSDDNYIIIEEEAVTTTTEGVDDEISSIPSQGHDEQISEFYSHFDSLFETFGKTRTYKKVLTEYSKKKLELLKIMDINLYLEMSLQHCKIIIGICDQKNYNIKRKDEIMRLCFSPLDLRLLLYQMNRTKFDKNLPTSDIGEMSVDDVDYLKKSLFISRYRGNKTEKIVSNFLNYGTAVITLKQSMELYFSNTKYIIYLNDDSVVDDKDPFRFYFLEKETKTKKYWEMDCRLDGLVSLFIKHVSQYLIQLFRTIYHDVFHDNLYRKDFHKSALIFENDCEQLLQNLCILTTYKDVSFLMMNTIKSNCSYRETESDVFRLKSDDKLLKKELERREKEIDLNLLVMLFDNVEESDIRDLYGKNYFKQ